MPTSKKLAREIRVFLDIHPHGWTHEEWAGLLHQLAGSGLDVSNPDGIGLALERARVQSTLKGTGIKGLGPKRIESIAAEFPFLHELRETDPDDLAARTGVPRKLAQEVAARIR